jgi:hypothetical protein
VSAASFEHDANVIAAAAISAAARSRLFRLTIFSSPTGVVVGCETLKTDESYLHGNNMFT